MKLNIVMLLTNSYNPDVRVYKEAKYLHGLGNNVTILCWDRECNEDLPAHCQEEGINIVRFKISSESGSGIKQLPAFIKYIRACKKYLTNTEYDYIHCNDLDGAITGYFADKKHSKRVFDMHEVYERGSGIKRKVWRGATIFFIKRSVAALYENDDYLGEAYKCIRSKLYELKNYPDMGMVQYLPKSKSDQFRIGYHGAVRGQIPEFNALFEAVKDMDDVRVDINGGGIDLNQLLEMSKHYGNVCVHGPYDGSKVSSELYENTDVLFVGYDPENPNYAGNSEAVKYYEAIVTRTPMIITKGIGMGDKVEKYKFGIACNTRDADEIRVAIKRLKNNKELLDEFARSENLVADYYTWENEVKVLNKIYQ